MTSLITVLSLQLLLGCFILLYLSKNEKFHESSQLDDKTYSELIHKFSNLDNNNNQEKATVFYKARKILIEKNFSLEQADKLIAKTIIRSAIRSMRFRVHNKCIPYRSQIRKRELAATST